MGNVVKKPVSLEECADRIRAAQSQARCHFQQFVKDVGGELETAQRLLASHKAGFGQWVSDEFGWSDNYARRIISAAAVMRIIVPIGTVKNLPLPESESQCRALSSLPTDKVAIAWERACEASALPGCPPTTAIVKAVCDEIQPPKKRAATTRAAKSSDVTRSATTRCRFCLIALKEQAILRFFCLLGCLAANRGDL